MFSVKSSVFSSFLCYQCSFLLTLRTKTKLVSAYQYYTMTSKNENCLSEYYNFYGKLKHIGLKVHALLIQ